VMAGLERPDSGEVVVSGTPFNALDEDALARFRGRPNWCRRTPRR